MLKNTTITRASAVTLLFTTIGVMAFTQGTKPVQGRATNIDRTLRPRPIEGRSGTLAADSCACDPARAIPFTPFTLAQIGGMMQPARPNLAGTDVVTVGTQSAPASTILTQMNDLEQRLNACGFSLRKGWDGPGPECKNELSPTDLAELNAKKALALGAHQWGRKDGADVNPARKINPGGWSGGGQTQAPFPAFTNALNSLSSGTSPSAQQTGTLLNQSYTGVTWRHGPINRWVPAGTARARGGVELAPQPLSESAPLPPPPPFATVTRSQAWDTGVIGRKDIYAADLHTQIDLSADSTSTNVDGTLKLTLWSFNNPFVHELHGAVVVPQVGQEQTNLTYQDPDGNTSSLYSHSGPYMMTSNYNSGNLDMQFTVGIGCGPVYLYATFNPTLLVKYDYRFYAGSGSALPATSVAGGSTWGQTNIRPAIAYAEFKPRTSVTVNATAAATFLFVVTSGVSTDLKVIDWQMEARGLAKLDFRPSGTNYTAYVGLYTEALDQVLMMVNANTPIPAFGTTPSGTGTLNAFVTYPKLPQWFWNGATKTAQRPIWSWNGFGAGGWLVNYYLNYEQPI